MANQPQDRNRPAQQEQNRTRQDQNKPQGQQQGQRSQNEKR